MKDSRPTSVPASGDKPKARGAKGAPIGVHSLTGDPAAVGMPLPEGVAELDGSREEGSGPGEDSPAGGSPSAGNG